MFFIEKPTRARCLLARSDRNLESSGKPLLGSVTPTTPPSMSESIATLDAHRSGQCISGASTMRQQSLPDERAKQAFFARQGVAARSAGHRCSAVMPSRAQAPMGTQCVMPMARRCSSLCEAMARAVDQGRVVLWPDCARYKRSWQRPKRRHCRRCSVSAFTCHVTGDRPVHQGALAARCSQGRAAIARRSGTCAGSPSWDMSKFQ